MSGSPIIQDGKLIGAVTHLCTLTLQLSAWVFGLLDLAILILGNVMHHCSGVRSPRQSHRYSDSGSVDERANANVSFAWVEGCYNQFGQWCMRNGNEIGAAIIIGFCFLLYNAVDRYELGKDEVMEALFIKLIWG